MVRCHPDKSRNPRDHDKYNRAHAKWNRVKRAKKVLALPDEDGCFAARVAYDKRGEELRGLMEAAVDEIYNLPLASRAEQIKERHKREADYQRRKQNQMASARTSILAKISKQWKTGGQQQNVGLRLLVCKAFESDYSNAEIALEVRQFAFRGVPFDEKRRKKDKFYDRILRRIQTYKQEFSRGDMDKIRALKGQDRKLAVKRKSVKAGTQGPKATSENDAVEAEVYAYLEDLWKKERRVTRSIIFRKAMEVDPRFLGGTGSEGHMEKLKCWFYYRFKISSVGQKLPKDADQ